MFQNDSAENGKIKWCKKHWQESFWSRKFIFAMVFRSTGCVREEFTSLLQSYVVEMRTLRAHTLYLLLSGCCDSLHVYKNYIYWLDIFYFTIKIIFQFRNFCGEYHWPKCGFLFIIEIIQLYWQFFRFVQGLVICPYFFQK